MKRLDELESDDPHLRQAQRLLSSVDPLPSSPEHMWRVRRSLQQKLDERAARGAGWRGWTHGPRALGLAALLLLVGGGTTLAAAQSGALSAMIARVARVIQLAPASPPLAAKRPLASRAAPARARQAPASQPALQAQAAQPALDAPDQAPAAVLPAATPTPTLSANHPRRHNARARAVQARADNEAVRRAVKALRRDGNPGLAAKLLEEAHQNSPDGVLAEEVMSLRVEAALALADARARSYAREYLARYPRGRYRAEVERALH